MKTELILWSLFFTSLALIFTYILPLQFLGVGILACLKGYAEAKTT